MSLKQTYNLAHTARCKLHLAADRPDRDLRFLVGHAMHLDSLMLRIVEIEESIEQPSHATGITIQGASGGGSYKKSPLARRSPPPLAAEDESESDGDEGDDDEDDNLSLTRFPSGSARPPRDSPAPPLDPSDGDSSSSDEEDYQFDPEFLRSLIKTDSDDGLKDLYTHVGDCPCHKSDAPTIERMWEVPSKEGDRDGVRFAVAEIRA